MFSTKDKKVRVPKTDIKKKPSYDLLKLIGENSQQDITPHPFTKIKKPKGPKIEDIFIKAKQSKKKKSNSKV